MSTDFRRVKGEGNNDGRADARWGRTARSDAGSGLGGAVAMNETNNVAVPSIGGGSSGSADGASAASAIAAPNMGRERRVGEEVEIRAHVLGLAGTRVPRGAARPVRGWALIHTFQRVARGATKVARARGETGRLASVAPGTSRPLSPSLASDASAAWSRARARRRARVDPCASRRSRVGATRFDRHARRGSLGRSSARTWRVARPLAPLGLNVSNSSLRTSMSTDLGASYNLTDEGIRLLSASAREFKLTSAGLKTTTRGDDASTPPADLSYRCSAKDLHVFDVIGSGAGGVVKKAVHVTTHRFVALKVMTVFDKDKRRQLVGGMRTLCDSPRQRGLVSFLGAYYSPETNQINIALEYVDGGSLESLVKRGGPVPVAVAGRIAGRRRGSRVPPRATPAGPPRHQTGNILVKRTGEPKITDFGIVAELGATRAMLDSFKGTMCYMSPERVENKDYGRSADVWSLGVTLLRVRAGAVPVRRGRRRTARSHAADHAGRRAVSRESRFPARIRGPGSLEVVQGPGGPSDGELLPAAPVRREVRPRPGRGRRAVRANSHGPDGGDEVRRGDVPAHYTDSWIDQRPDRARWRAFTVQLLLPRRARRSRAETP